MHKTYELVCHLPADAALQRIEDLLLKEGVKYNVAGLAVASTQIPIVLFGFDPRLYSHNNWVGLNPFIVVSSVDVRFESGDTGLTRVIVRISRLRAFLWVAFWVCSSCLAALAMPQPAGVILVFGVASVAWFGIVSFLGGYLIRKEIGDHLEDGEHEHH